MTLATRRLGAQGLEVPAIGFGAMGIAGAAGMTEMYGPVDVAEAVATIQRAIDLGAGFIDTAEVYGPYRNEEIVGRAIRGRRHEVVLATKFGFRIGAALDHIGLDGSPENARRALEGSLRRLGTDCIDLWYLHRLDPAVPIEETVGAMAEQVRAGKVRYLGLSEVGANTLRRAHAVHPISALQSEYSVWERGLEAGGDESVLATCRALGIGLVAYCPLGRGFLAGNVPRAESLPQSDYRRRDPRFAGENYDRNLRIVRALESGAARHGATAAQIALAWLLHRGEDVVPIPGTKRRTYLEQNVAAADIRLGPGDLAELDAAGTAAGERYSGRSRELIDR